MKQATADSMTEAMSVPSILLTETTRWPCAARLAIGLSKTGSQVSAVCPTRDPLMKTRAVRQTFPYSGLRPLESLISAIKATDPQILIPCDDRAVQHLHELHQHSQSLGSSGRKIAELIENSLGPPESYPIVIGRFELLKLASEEGVHVPDTKPIRSRAELSSWQKVSKFPWVLKADATFGGRGVRIVDSWEQAEQGFLELTRLFGGGRAFKRFCVNRDAFWLRPWWNQYEPAIIAQSYIDGSPANCAVVCRKGRVLAGVSVQVVQADGLTGPASVVRVVDSPEMLSAAEKLARRLNLCGFFGLDFMIEHESGTLYLIEMNPRSTPLCHLQLGATKDMVRALWSDLSGQPFQEAPAVTCNNLIAYFPQAWTSNSEFLNSSFQDIPEGEPELVQELLRPTSDRNLLGQAANQLQRFRRFVTLSAG